MIWVRFAKKYLGAYAAKDIDYLKSVYSEDIAYSDWGVFIQGKEAVLTINKSFFSNVGDIEIHIQNTTYKDKYISLEYVVLYDNKSIRAASVIEINDYGKISSIRAYRQ
jgi:hypothetical protein